MKLMTQGRRIVRLAGSEPLLANPESLLQEDSETAVTLDLSEVMFVCPLDLVAIAAWSTSLPADRRGEVVLPSSPTASYLERMNLLRQSLVGSWWKSSTGGNEVGEEILFRGDRFDGKGKPSVGFRSPFPHWRRPVRPARESGEDRVARPRPGRPRIDYP
jgi:hypothetical protein